MTKASTTFGPEPEIFQCATSFYFTLPFNFNIFTANFNLEQQRNKNFVEKTNHKFQSESISSIYHSNINILVLILHSLLQHNTTTIVTLAANTEPLDLLAINSNQLFTTMLSTELINCIHLSETFFCRGRRELRTDIDQNRRSALYLGITDHIKGQCQLHFTTTKQKGFEQTENLWIVFTQRSFITNQHLPHKTEQRSQNHSGSIFRIKLGCGICAKQHILDSNDSMEFTVNCKINDWEWALDQPFLEHQAKQVLDAIEDLNNEGSSLTDATDLFKEIDELNKVGNHCMFSLPSLLDGAFILTAALLARCLGSKDAGNLIPRVPTIPTTEAPPSCITNPGGHVDDPNQCQVQQKTRRHKLPDFCCPSSNPSGGGEGYQNDILIY